MGTRTQAGNEACAFRIGLKSLLDEAAQKHSKETLGKEQNLSTISKYSVQESQSTSSYEMFTNTLTYVS